MVLAAGGFVMDQPDCAAYLIDSEHIQHPVFPIAPFIDGPVRRADGAVIPGLYAADACASNIAQDSLGYASGTQLGEGSFFGRRAGRHAAHGTLTP